MFGFYNVLNMGVVLAHMNVIGFLIFFSFSVDFVESFKFKYNCSLNDKLLLLSAP